MSKHDFKVGDIVVEVITLHRKSIEKVRITKVGRRWVSYESLNYGYGIGRFDINDLTIDGGDYTSPGKIYLSIEHYEKAKETKELYALIQEKFNTYGPPPSWFTIEKGRKILSLMENVK